MPRCFFCSATHVEGTSVYTSPSNSPPSARTAVMATTTNNNSHNSSHNSSSSNSSNNGGGGVRVVCSILTTAGDKDTFVTQIDDRIVRVGNLLNSG